MQEKINQDLKQALLSSMRNPFAVSHRSSAKPSLLAQTGLAALPEVEICKNR